MFFITEFVNPPFGLSKPAFSLIVLIIYLIIITVIETLTFAYFYNKDNENKQ